MRLGPHRRRAIETWELWNLRALRPWATREDLAALKERRRWIDRCEQWILTQLAKQDKTLLMSGRSFLSSHPELTSGLVVTMHLGPYQLMPEPYLHRGIQPAVLLDQRAYDRLRSRAERLQGMLHLGGELQWLPIAGQTFVRRMITVLRAGRPLFVFLDGNSGLGGSRQTREVGILYSLPGRQIRVRTGLARLACKLGCPVHPLVLRWDHAGEIIWRKEPSRTWHRDDDPEEVTRWLYDWGFGEVLRSPEQWRYWEMLKESYACFATSRLTEAQPPPAARINLNGTLQSCLDRASDQVGIELTKEVEVWPGDVLANLSDDCFYRAAGLSAEELAELGRRSGSLNQLVDRFGREWVFFHVTRLCLLELARLRGV